MKKIFKKIYYICGTFYRGMIGIFDNIFDREEEIPENIEKEVIGKTVQGREILVYKIGAGEKRLLITGGIHGNEVGTVRLAKKIINYFYNNKINLKLYIIPVLNIDGYLQAKKNPDYIHRGKVGRFNTNKVDLNRNFPTQNFQQYSEWKTGKNYAEKADQVFCGEYAASEPEIKSFIDFIKNNNIKNLIILHNVGKDVMIDEDNNISKKWAEIYKKYAEFNIKYGLGVSGGALGWAKENNINYIAVEGGSRWGSDWGSQGKAVIEVLKALE